MSATWTPPLPYELVEATEHHGPYICNSYGTTVCDFYFMTDPSVFSVRNGGHSKPISFTDAAEHAAFLVKAANAHDEMLAALKRVSQTLEAIDDLPSMRADVDAAIAAAEGAS